MVFNERNLCICVTGTVIKAKTFTAYVVYTNNKIERNVNPHWSPIKHYRSGLSSKRVRSATDPIEKLNSPPRVHFNVRV